MGDADRLKQVIREELEEVVAEFGDERLTEIVDSQHDLSVEDLITPEDRVVTISHGGYAKTQPLSDYQAQRRGGMGKSATAVKDNFNETGFSLGSRVRHPKFGEGTIINFEGSGPQSRVQVAFNGEGIKWLVTAYARLEKL